MNTILQYKDKSGKIKMVKMAKTPALFNAHYKVLGSKEWNGSVVWALNKKGQKSGIYAEYGKEIKRQPTNKQIKIILKGGKK